MTTNTIGVLQHSKHQISSNKELPSGFEQILTEDALLFLQRLQEKFGTAITVVLEERVKKQKEINEGKFPDFLDETESIRKSDWKVSEVPKDLLDRRIEITGPPDRKMVINALNSGANVFMADFEDSQSPTFANVIQGQINLKDAIRRTISFDNANGKKYTLNENPAILFCRPRGLHLKEKNLLLEGEPLYGCLVDFGFYIFHNAITLLDLGNGPYFYLPKLQNHKEARIWKEIFEFSEDYLKLERGTIKATVLLEHILAAFEMDEILYELKNHSIGLNCGRWDYIFSFIKTFSNFKEFVLPDRAEVGMTVHFLDSYVKLLIKTCHRRGTFAMGGMAAQIPIKGDEDKNAVALEKVKNDKLREVQAGHDGTWVAHPGLISVAKEVFDKHMQSPNQISLIPDYNVSAEDLIKVPSGNITKNGVKTNINVGLLYLTSWLQGNGCVPIYNLMEDAATAEISRSQLWQWVKHKVQLDNEDLLTPELFIDLLMDEVKSIKSEGIYNTERLDDAADLFRKLTLTENMNDFLTIKAYEILE